MHEAEILHITKMRNINTYIANNRQKTKHIITILLKQYQIHIFSIHLFVIIYRIITPFHSLTFDLYHNIMCVCMIVAITKDHFQFSLNNVPVLIHSKGCFVFVAILAVCPEFIISPLSYIC